jgi:hypothetical protein
MIALPDPPRRPWLSSFWGVLTVFTAVAVEVVGWLALDGWRLGGGVAAGLVLAVAGRVWPALPRAVYRRWNKLARLANRGLRFAVIAICYHMVVAPVSWLGSRMTMTAGRDEGTLWQPRQMTGPASYFHPYEEAGALAAGGTWSRSFRIWASGSGNAWAVCLLPFLALLAHLEVRGEGDAVPTDIYTVF